MNILTSVLLILLGVRMGHPMLFGLWEETRASEENPYRHGENMQIPHRKATASSNP